jgi:hypothetical protein
METSVFYIEYDWFANLELLGLIAILGVVSDCSQSLFKNNGNAGEISTPMWVSSLTK